MKRFWSKFIIVPALGCLLSLGALPALAYYPPLNIKITKKGSHEVIFHAKDPQDGNWHGDTLRFVDEVVERDGILAMIRHYPPGGNPRYKRVTCVTYDPYRKGMWDNGIKEDTQGPHTDISQLQVADGVVAYIATDPEGQKAFIYATYDPKEGIWRTKKSVPNDGLPGVPVSDSWVTTKNGVVVYRFISDTGGGLLNTLYADIYNPVRGNWQTALDGSQNSIGTINVPNDVYKNIGIDNSTISYSWENLPTREGKDEKRGYDYSTEKWYPDIDTKPMAYFAAQPSSGPSPLWAWFTDQSIGAANVDWSFGEGDTVNKRSTYHTYTRDGQYSAQQEIKGTGISSSQTINVGP